MFKLLIVIFSFPALCFSNEYLIEMYPMEQACAMQELLDYNKCNEYDPKYLEGARDAYIDVWDYIQSLKEEATISSNTSK